MLWILTHLFHNISFRDWRICCRICELGCDWIGLACVFACLLPDAVETEDSEGLLSPPAKLDAASFLETGESWEEAACFEGTPPVEGHGFLGISPLKLPAGLSVCFISDVLDMEGDFFGEKFLVREDACFSTIDAEAIAFFDAPINSVALSFFLFSSFWAVKTKKKMQY